VALRQPGSGAQQLHPGCLAGEVVAHCGVAGQLWVQRGSPARGQSASPTATARFSRTTGLAVRSSRQPRRLTGRPPIRADQKPFTAVSFSP
jgi:hypothetical protein